jgi:hypothetical protein
LSGVRSRWRRGFQIDLSPEFRILLLFSWKRIKAEKQIHGSEEIVCWQFWQAGKHDTSQTLVIFVGLIIYSEPTAQILAAIFHELSIHPEHIDKIREELGGVCITNFKALTELPHLNAVIQEAMRLHPNLLTGGSRKTTENGVTIGDVYIPPHITVITPHYTIARRMSSKTNLSEYFILISSGEDCFEQGSQFIPERWTTRPEMVRNSKGHIPFSIGKNVLFYYINLRNGGLYFYLVSANVHDNIQVSITALGNIWHGVS